MDISNVHALLSSPIEHMLLVVILGTLRIYGLTYSFFAFSWGLPQSQPVRVGICMSLATPILITSLDQTLFLAKTASPLQLALIAPKEFGLGFALGLLSSAPFRALQYAGSVIDGFRGESDSGIQSPDSSPIQTLSLLYVIIGFFVFFSIGGLWHLIGTLYYTYEIWPIETLKPELFSGAPDLALSALDSSFQLALLITAPLLIIMAVVEFILIIGTKLARRFGIYDMSFLLKNLIVVLTLPVVAFGILQVAETHTPNALLGVETMKEFFE